MLLGHYDEKHGPDGGEAKRAVHALKSLLVLKIRTFDFIAHAIGLWNRDLNIDAQEV